MVNPGDRLVRSAEFENRLYARIADVVASGDLLVHGSGFAEPPSEKTSGADVKVCCAATSD